MQISTPKYTQKARQKGTLFIPRKAIKKRLKNAPFLHKIHTVFLSKIWGKNTFAAPKKSPLAESRNTSKNSPKTAEKIEQNQRQNTTLFEQKNAQSITRKSPQNRRILPTKKATRKVKRHKIAHLPPKITTSPKPKNPLQPTFGHHTASIFTPLQHAVFQYFTRGGVFPKSNFSHKSNRCSKKSLENSLQFIAELERF